MDINNFFPNEYINGTKIDCNEENVDVVRDFVTDHMGKFICPLDTSMETISEYQTEIRHLIEPYMKLRLPHLRYTKFGCGEFYSLFVLMIVIDQVNEYNWDHVNSLMYFKYNEDDKDSHNQYGLVMRDDYYDLEEFNDGGDSRDVNCCCRQTCTARRSTKIHNGKFTFILGSACIKKTSIAYDKAKNSRIRRNDRLIAQERKRLQLEEQQRLEREAQRQREEATTMMCRGYDCGRRIPRSSWCVRCKRCFAILMSEQ